MSGSISILKAAGLYTSSNEVGSVPEGAMTEAKNVVIRSKDIVEPRRGFETPTLTTTFTGGVRSLHHYGLNLYATGGAGGVPDGTIARYTSVAETLDPLATALSAPTGGLRVVSFEAQDCLYLTSSEGIRKIDSSTGDHKQAAVPKPLEIVSATVILGSGTLWLPSEYKAGYVFTFCIRDATNRLLEGEPSGITVADNDDPTQAGHVALTLRLPQDITTSHFIRVYRTVAVPRDFASTPADYYLVYERPISSTEVTNKVTNQFADQTPEDYAGTLGYFSANVDSLAKARTEPPLATDAAYFGNRALYANTTLRHTNTLEILGLNKAATAGVEGLKPGDIITIAGLAYTAVTGAPTTGEFNVWAASDWSGDSYQAILQTARSLAKAINTDTRGSEIYAYSVPNELRDNSPGGLVLERRSLSQGVFYMTASSGGSAVSYLSPALPTSGTTIASSNEAGPNRIYWSERDIPEAVPRLNYITVGAKNKKILRLVALRDRCFIFKEDGIFALSGDMENCRVYPLDPTVICVAPDTVAAVNNEIYALTNKGVVKVSDAGAQVVSKGIERDLVRHIAERYSGGWGYFFDWGCGYETENLYLLGVADTTEGVDRIYVYNTASGAWTWWDVQAGCAIVDPTTNKLYLGGGTGEFIRKERKSLTNADYNDGETGYQAATPTSYMETGGTIVDLGGGLYECNVDAAPPVGTYLQYNTPDSVLLVTEVIDGNTINVLLISGDAPAASRMYLYVVPVYTPYECIAEWAAKAPAGPGSSASLREAELIFRDAFFASADFGVATEGAAAVTREVHVPEMSGYDSTDVKDWGGNRLPVFARVGIDRDVSRGRFFRARFAINEANAMWGLQGIVLLGAGTSERGQG